MSDAITNEGDEPICLLAVDFEMCGKTPISVGLSAFVCEKGSVINDKRNIVGKIHLNSGKLPDPNDDPRSFKEFWIGAKYMKDGKTQFELLDDMICKVRNPPKCESLVYLGNGLSTSHTTPVECWGACVEEWFNRIVSKYPAHKYPFQLTTDTTGFDMLFFAEMMNLKGGLFYLFKEYRRPIQTNEYARGLLHGLSLSTEGEFSRAAIYEHLGCTKPEMAVEKTHRPDEDATFIALKYAHLMGAVNAAGRKNRAREEDAAGRKKRAREEDAAE